MDKREPTPHCHFCMQEGRETTAVYMAKDEDYIPDTGRMYCIPHAKYFIESKYYTVPKLKENM